MIRGFQKIGETIQGKLLLFFGLSLLLITFLTWICQRQILLISVEDDEEAYVHNLAAQIAGLVRKDRENYENLLIQLSNNRTISQTLSEEYGHDYSQVWDGVDEIRYLARQQMGMSPGIRNLHLQHDNDTFCEDGRYLFLVPGAQISKDAMDWEMTSSGIGQIGRPISGMYHDRNAYLYLRIDMGYVFGRYLAESESPGARYYIKDVTGRYLTGSGTSHIPDLTEEQLAGLQSGSVYRNQEQKSITVCAEAGGGWYVFVEYPMFLYNSDKLHSGGVVFVVLLLYCLAIGGLLFLFLKNIFSRLQNIGSNLEEIGRKDFRFLENMRGHDEISRLEEQYNGMLHKLSSTIDEMAEMKTKKQQLEIRVLESQINPHFLYNTLGAMQWKAIEANNKELCEMIENLTLFYRRSMSRGTGLVPVKNELEQIQAYIAIQQIRYDHCVSYTIAAEDKVKEYCIPKMILQPLVENIYLHAGIVLEGRREIKIDIREEQNFLVIQVRDNGNGMEERILYNVNHNINVESEHGVGISFIHNSLNAYYGEKGTLRFESSLGEGTVATMRIPLENISGIVTGGRNV